MDDSPAPSQEEELDFRALFEGVPGLFMVLEPKAPTFTVLGASRAYLDATKAGDRPFRGRPLFEVFPDNPSDLQASGVSNLRHSLETVIATRAPHTMAVQKYDIPLPPEQGGGFEERHWSCLNSPVLGADGRIRYIVHRAEDVTEFVRLREQRTELLTRAERMESEIYMRAGQVQSANRELARLNEKLKRNDELKSQFFANVSHELRTPLTLILGPVDRALGEDGRSEGDQRLLKSVRRNARLLLKHVNDILEITTLEAGKVEPSYVEVDLARLARQIASNFESLAEVRQLELQVRSPQRLTAQVDPAKLQRIVLNLLANAIKFTPPGGTVEFTVEGQGEQAALSVADSGPGIPEELRTRVFERFFQTEEATTRRYGGTGLGLSIVREFVQLHGGSVDVAASRSGGALFTVRLPLQAPKGARVTAASMPAEPEPMEANELLGGELTDLPEEAFVALPQGTAGARPESWAESEWPVVLVVEDNRDMASYICASLGSYRTRRARNGREGLESALAEVPDLIISDVMMPGMSGPQMVEEMRQHPQLNRVPVVMLTARAEDDLRVKLLRAGAQDYLVKPFSAEELISRVDNLIKVKRFQERLEVAYADLKAAQVQLVQAAKMASLGQLVAGIAHEINNPLAYAASNISSVTGWVEQVSPHVVDALPPELLNRWERVQDRLASSAEGIERVKGLVLKLRTFSRLDEGEFKTVEVPESIESVLAFLEHRLEGRIVVRRDYGPLTTLGCFPGGLNQVLMNLVSNSIDAIEGDGTITVSTRHDEANFYISVRDTGSGLPDGVKEKMFEPFFTTKPVGVGTGLGLSISFGIMGAHRGRILAENRPEGGCEMVLEIPRNLERPGQG